MRPLSASVDSSCDRQLHDGFDTTSHAPPVAPLECFITTESAFGDTQGFHEHHRLYSRHRVHKQHDNPTAQLSECSAEQTRSRPSIWSIPLNSQEKYSPSACPMQPNPSGPRSIASFPSSPDDSSSVAMSEDPHSLSASFSELPRNQSPSRFDHPISARGTVPQLVMPSLTVPQRRPFSETGRSLGTLKILVTGNSGTGKKSLMVAIALSSAHIVHMDSMDLNSKSKMRSTYASTRPKPWWRLDSQQNFAQRRRSSIPEEVLDRNICFVDCKAHGGDHSTMFPAVEYVESQLAHLLGSSIDYASLSTLLSGGSEPNVDVVLYLLSSAGPSSADIKCMRSLQATTNVIPLLSRADTLSDDELAIAKSTISQGLRAEGIDCFSFAPPGSTQERPFIYAVSNLTQMDRDTVDASILMASDYLPPLVYTDLHSLVSEMISVDGSAWLRHSASSKVIRWLRRQRCRSGASQSALLCKKPSSKVYTYTSTVMDERIPLNLQHWEKLYISSWAEALRQSLFMESFAHFQGHTCVDTVGNHMALTRTDSLTPRLRPRHGRNSTDVLLSSHQDPLGLLELVSRVQAGGTTTLKLLSSLSILGCAVAWIVQPGVVHQRTFNRSGSLRCF